MLVMSMCLAINFDPGALSLLSVYSLCAPGDGG